MKKNLTEKILAVLENKIRFLLGGFFMLGLLNVMIHPFFDNTNSTQEAYIPERCEVIILGDKTLFVKPGTMDVCEIGGAAGFTIPDFLSLFLFGIVALAIIGVIVVIILWIITSILGRVGLNLLRQDIEELDKGSITQMSIEDILSITQRMLRHSRILSFGNKLGKIHASMDFREKVKSLYAKNSLKIIEILQDTKEKLNTEIHSIRLKLKSAKSELASIEGENSLIAVKLEQQIRLDRQIEQFEELQKVLVKI